ncbi:MAG: sulfite exporter TauE/SafE family protein [Phycisphaerales bacterium JB037]
MIYAIVGALVIGLSLGVFGSGGSILTVPVLIYLLHHEPKVAIAESLAIVGSIALVACLLYARDKLVDWRLAALFGLPGMAGTFAGSWVAGFVSGAVQLLVFAGVMAIAAVSMWKRSRPARAVAEGPPAGANASTPHATPRRASVPAAATQGIGVGLMTGFVGVGGGFLIVPALVLVAGLAMRRAVATSLVIIAMNAATGLIKHHHALTDAGAEPAWGVIALFVAIGIAGSFAGKALSGRLNQRALQRGFAVFLVAMAAFILIRESLAWSSSLQAAPQSLQGDQP